VVESERPKGEERGGVALEAEGDDDGNEASAAFFVKESARSPRSPRWLAGCLQRKQKEGKGETKSGKRRKTAQLSAEAKAD